VHTLAVSTLLNASEILFFDDIGYEHAPYAHMPLRAGATTALRCERSSSQIIDWLPQSCLSRWLEAFKGLQGTHGTAKYAEDLQDVLDSDAHAFAGRLPPAAAAAGKPWSPLPGSDSIDAAAVDSASMLAQASQLHKDVRSASPLLSSLSGKGESAPSNDGDTIHIELHKRRHARAQAMQAARLSNTAATLSGALSFATVDGEAAPVVAAGEAAVYAAPASPGDAHCAGLTGDGGVCSSPWHASGRTGMDKCINMRTSNILSACSHPPLLGTIQVCIRSHW
jgi:hypothetical protein